MTRVVAMLMLGYLIAYGLPEKLGSPLWLSTFVIAGLIAWATARDDVNEENGR